MDEQRAIQRLKRGEISGLELLVSHHQVKAVRVAYLIMRDLELAEFAARVESGEELVESRFLCPCADRICRLVPWKCR
jgi:hypothetical protein